MGSVQMVATMLGVRCRWLRWVDVGDDDDDYDANACDVSGCDDSDGGRGGGERVLRTSRYLRGTLQACEVELPWSFQPQPA